MNLYQGRLPDGTHFLLTVFDDGTAEAALRPDAWSTWSAPIPLHAEPIGATA